MTYKSRFETFVLTQDLTYRMLYTKVDNGIILIREYYSIFEEKYDEISRIFIDDVSFEKLKRF